MNVPTYFFQCWSGSRCVRLNFCLVSNRTVPSFSEKKNGPSFQNRFLKQNQPQTPSFDPQGRRVDFVTEWNKTQCCHQIEKARTIPWPALVITMQGRCHRPRILAGCRAFTGWMYAHRHTHTQLNMDEQKQTRKCELYKRRQKHTHRPVWCKVKQEEASIQSSQLGGTCSTGKTMSTSLWTSVLAELTHMLCYSKTARFTHRTTHTFLWCEDDRTAWTQQKASADKQGE